MNILLAVLVAVVAADLAATTALLWVVLRTAGYKLPRVRLPKLRGPKPRYYA